jgi:hypothetical protein
MSPEEVGMVRIATSGLAAAIAILMWSPIENETSARGPVETIDRARQLLLGADPSEDRCRSGFLALLDAAVEAARAGGLPAELRAKLEAARDRFGRSFPADEQGTLALGACHRLLASGRAFELPKEITSIEDARRHIGRLLDSARTLLSDNKMEAGVRAMVEAAMAVVTPMVAPLEAAAPTRVHLGVPPR